MLEELPDPLPEGEGLRFGLLLIRLLGLGLLDLLGPDEDLDALGRAVAAVRQGLRIGGGVHEKEVAIFPGELVPGVLDEAGDVVLGVLHLAGLAETAGGGAQGGGEAVQGLLGAAVRLLPGGLQHVDNAIVGFNGKAAVTSSNFAYIYSLVDIAPGVDEDGLPVSGGQRAYFVKADGTKGNAVVSSKSAKIEKDTVIAYSINANGEISVAKPAAGTGTTGAFKTANIGKSYNKVEGFYMSSTTKFVFVDTSKGLSITTVDGYKNVVDQKGVKVYVVADGVNAKYVFVQAKAASATSDAKYGFLLDTVPSVRKAADNSDLYVFSVMIDGNNKAELISSDADAFKGIAKNDRFSYTEKDGKLASVMAAPAKAEWSGKDHYVEVVGEGYLGLKGVNDTVTLADKCVVYEYDSATNTYAESTVAVNSILNVYVNAKNEVTMIVIVGEHETD